MKKILILFTGGTIGSKVNSGIIDVEESGKFALIDAYEKSFGKQTDFECRQVLNILSENFGFDDWEKLISEIENVKCDDYAGIIITHGSDTLAYTSALLGMYFRHIEIPVFIIASNKPIGEKGSNGLYNFSAAVEQIKSGCHNGVFTLYEKVYLPTRIMPADTYCDKFHSYGDDGVCPNGDFYNLSDSMLEKKREQFFHSHISFKKNIMVVHGYPMENFSCLEPDEKTAAVLYVPYHSGTGCVTEKYGDEHSLVKFIEKCLIKNKMVYICGVKPSEIKYSTLAKIIGTGSIPLYSISEVSAYMKLLLAYNQNEYPAKEVMKKNLYFEIV